MSYDTVLHGQLLRYLRYKMRMLWRCTPNTLWSTVFKRIAVAIELVRQPLLTGWFIEAHCERSTKDYV